VGSVEDAGKALMERVEPGDLVITCGAGNIYQAGEMLLEELKKNVFEKEDE
jgi:UDP-N-acetylmuramate-alanine ligase